MWQSPAFHGCLFFFFFLALTAVSYAEFSSVRPIKQPKSRSRSRQFGDGRRDSLVAVLELLWNINLLETINWLLFNQISYRA